MRHASSASRGPKRARSLGTRGRGALPTLFPGRAPPMNNSWLLASETEGGVAAVEKSYFSDTLYLELKSVLLLGQLRICFAAADKSYSVTIRFETVEDHFYREGIELILAGVDPARTGTVEKGRSEAAMFERWPMKIRNEGAALLAQRAAVPGCYSVAGCFRRSP